MRNHWLTGVLLLTSLALFLPEVHAGDDPRELPLLAPGKHLGVIQFQQGATPEARARIKTLWDEAVAKGMSVARVHTDWDALETGPGEYQKASVEEQMKSFHEQGLQFMVTISTLDTGALTLPPDLQDPEDQTRLADGMNIDDPKVAKRFLALLDWVVPLMTRYGGFLLSVANEPDTMFEDHPEYIQGLANLIAASRRHVQAINPKMAVSATLTGGAFRPGDEWVPTIMNECDVALFNYYGLNPLTLQVEDDFKLKKYMADAARVADGRQFIIQEWGCPGGYEDKPTVMNASLERQREYFAETAEVMLAEPKFRAAFVFELVDWSPELVTMFNDILTQGVEDESELGVLPPLTEWLRTTGLVRYEDGSPRPGWHAFLDSIETLAARQDES